MSSQPKVLKFVLIGDCGVGKSSIMTRFISGEFEEQSYHTIGVEFLTKNITVDGKCYTLQIWDTAGQERFKSLRTPFYRGADFCLLTFSLDNLQSFHNLTMWKNEFLYYADIKDKLTFPFMVVGNKNDVSANEKEVDSNEVIDWCRNNGGYSHIETSARSNHNIIQCFSTAVRKVVSLQSESVEASMNMLSDASRINLRSGAGQSNSNRWCCS